MRYDPKNTNEKLKNVPFKDRSFIYNAAIIIEFLNETFMPTWYFLRPEMVDELGARDLKASDLKNPKDMEGHSLPIKDMYEYYKLFRQQKLYTSPVESYYKFSIIIKKLLYKKNGWKFRVRRTTRHQTVCVSPAQLRVRVPLEIRKLFPPPVMNISEGQVEAEIKDEEVESERVEPDTNDPSQFPAEGSDIGY